MFMFTPEAGGFWFNIERTHSRLQGGEGTVLRVVRQEAEQFFELVDSDEAWESPTGAGHWQARDLVGHLVDTTEEYIVAFDAARTHKEVAPASGS